MTESLPESLHVLRLDTELPLPARAHETDAGLDLYSAVAIMLEPGGRALIACGVAVAVPEGFCGMIVPRSGRAASEGLSLVNSPGIIDSGYRGEVKVVAINTDSERSIEVKRGERIAQLVIVPVALATVTQVAWFEDATTRGPAGFGSTGVK